MNRRIEEEIRRAQAEKRRPPDRTVYIPGEDPGEFGRRAARDLFEKNVKPALAGLSQKASGSDS